jgi:hypothetical protein
MVVNLPDGSGVANDGGFSAQGLWLTVFPGRPINKHLMDVFKTF